jgi:carbamoyl-phosphate synthase small subunit
MTTPAFVVLEDGKIYRGESFGAPVAVYGEVVFTTAMTGYQEMLTDPSFAGQIVVPTYPLQGNYGINDGDVESRQIQAAGFIVRGHSSTPSHALSDRTLHEYLLSQDIPGVSGVDTRALTRRLRVSGVMMGAVAVGISPEEALAHLRQGPRYGAIDLVQQVSTNELFAWEGGGRPFDGQEHGDRKRIVVTDYGVKYNILRILERNGCEVIAAPPGATAEEVLGLRPDGVLLSPGPGDPVNLDYGVQTARGLIGKLPIMGICLGHQVIARALGGNTYKLKFGHRGANHPVKELHTDAVHITAQNHGYAVDGDGLPSELEVTHVSLNDGTVEGLRHRSAPVITIQYHSEASPGPRDNEYLFDAFMRMVWDGRR